MSWSVGSIMGGDIILAAATLFTGETETDGGSVRPLKPWGDGYGERFGVCEGKKSVEEGREGPYRPGEGVGFEGVVE